MSEEIASLYASIGADTSGLDKGLAGAATGLEGTRDQISGLNKDLKPLGVNLGSTGDLLSGLGIALPISPMQVFGQAIAFSIGQAAEAQEVLAQTEAVIKSTGGAAGVTAKQVVSLAAALQQESRFSDDAIQKGENLLLTFTNIGSDVFPEATKAMVDMASALGTDVAGGAIQLGKALNDPIAGISALQRVGVSFTEAQKDVIKSLVETGDVAGAQQIILAELNKEFGGSAQASAQTYAGSIDQAKNALGDLGETAGNVVLPVLGDIAKETTQGIQYWQNATAAILDGRQSLLDFEATGYSVIFTDKTLAEANAELTASAAAQQAPVEAASARWAGLAAQYAASQVAAEAATVSNDIASGAIQSQTQWLDDLAAVYTNTTTPATYGQLTATDLLSEGLGGLTKELIFNKAAAGLDSDAALQLGVSMGMVDTRVLELNELLPVLKAKYDSNHDGAISAAEAAGGYTAAVQALSAALLSIPSSVTSTVTTNFVNNGAPYVPNGTTGAPAGPPPAAIPQAAGGDWMVTGPTLFLAGEAGPERATFTPQGSSGAGGGDAELASLLRGLPGMIQRAIRDGLVSGQ